MSAALADAPISAASAMLTAKNFFMTPTPILLSQPSVQSALRKTPRSEMPDEVRSKQPHVRFVGRDGDRRRVEIAVEGRCVEGAVVSHFRTQLDLRREPMLQTEPDIGIASGYG